MSPEATPDTLPQPLILLASTSAHRKLLLARLNLPFECLAPDVDEALQAGELPRDRSARLALAKARAVAAHPGIFKGSGPSPLVIGSDQVASIDQHGFAQILRKPGNRSRCGEQLALMSGKVARFDTSVAVIHGTQVMTHTDTTLVRFRSLTPAQIARYMDHEPAFDCAGGFKCEGLGVTLFESIESSDPTALVGLPLIWLCETLRHCGLVI
jgi:septum formation protein